MLQVIELMQMLEPKQSWEGKKIANTTKRALNGRARKKWTDIMNKKSTWNKANIREKERNYLNSWTYKKQVKVIEERLLSLSEEQDLRDSFKRLFGINRENHTRALGVRTLRVHAEQDTYQNTSVSRDDWIHQGGGGDLTGKGEILTKIEELMQNTKVQGGEMEQKKKDEPYGTNFESTACRIND